MTIPCKFFYIIITFYKSLNQQISDGMFGPRNRSFKKKHYKRKWILFGFPFMAILFKTEVKEIKKKRRM